MFENLNPQFFIGLILILLGLSFVYRLIRAVVFGKVNYWDGFLPITIISPLFLHMPPPPSPAPGKRSTGLDSRTGKKTLIREASGLWVHLFVSPIFLVLSVMCLAAGCDLMGLPGTDTVNYIVNRGDIAAPKLLVYDKRFTFSSPLLKKAFSKFGKNSNEVKIPLPEDKRLTPDLK